ncbi:hypothetical protein LINPERPRIM_LOCUS21055 [Linum perenne]
MGEGLTLMLNGLDVVMSVGGLGYDAVTVILFGTNNCGCRRVVLPMWGRP